MKPIIVHVRKRDSDPAVRIAREQILERAKRIVDQLNVNVDKLEVEK